MTTRNSSILIFEMNKKYLLYQIITKELKIHLKSEIFRNFGAKYIIEKSQQNSEFYSSNNNQFNVDKNKISPFENLENSNNKADESTASNFTLTNDLVYEYFSALVASFEIAKEINYVYEYAFFSQNKYIIRFHMHKNFLILILFNYNDISAINESSELKNQIYSEYYTSWFCKSLISLIKYKFGICTDDRCFKDATENKLEIKNLYLKWSNYFLNENLYFIEAIEKLEVNEDVRKKCEQFISELCDFFAKAETMWAELDDNESMGTNASDEDFQFLGNDEDTPPPIPQASLNKNPEFDEFFTADLSQINQFVFSYGGRLLYKTNLSIDSSSLFMLLLESAHFLDYKTKESDSDGEDYDEDAFKSASSSVSAESAIEMTNESLFRNESSHSLPKPSYSDTLADSFQSVMSTPFRLTADELDFKSEDIESRLGQPQDSETSKSSPVQFKRFKKSSCFLETANKTSIAYYDTLYFKLTDNLCLILLKPSKFAKYCELMADFDVLLEDFSDQIDRKRNKASLTPNDEETSTQQSKLKRSSTISVSFEDEQQRLSKAFFGFFMNKLIILYDKLKNLKAELNTRSISMGAKDSFLSRALNLNKKIIPKSKSVDNSNFFKQDSTEKNSGYVSFSTSDRALAIKLINTLQVKLNQFTSSRQFKTFINGVNSGNSNNNSSNSGSGDQSQPESEDADMRYISAQISSIRGNLNDLFYELFLTNSVTVTKNVRLDNVKTDSILKLKSTYITERLELLYAKHLYHYCPFIELKLKRNISMAYYSYLLPGLIHFSFVNRQDNVCILPTIDPALNYNITESKIISAYRKYVPIVIKLLYKFECAKLRFWDDRLELVFNYLVWFEDRSGNRIPVDFSLGSKQFESREILHDESKHGRGIQNQQNKNFLPGITEKSFYDQLKSICYPNASPESLICYELFSLHSARLKDEKVDYQFKYLVANLAKISKSNQ